MDKPKIYPATKEIPITQVFMDVIQDTKCLTCGENLIERMEIRDGGNIEIIGYCLKCGSTYS